MSTFHERLKNERLERGLSQEKFGKIGGVGKQAQIKYEKGERFPDAAYLMALNNVGYDVSYIITGNQSDSLNESNVTAMSHFPETKTASDCHFKDDVVLETPYVFSPIGIADGNEEVLFKGMADSLLDDIQCIDDELDINYEPEEMPMPVLSESFKNKLLERVQHLKKLGAPRKMYGMKGGGEVKSLALLPYLSVEASAGHGAIIEHEETSFMVAFDRDWLRREVGVAPQYLRLIKACGDSMNSGKGLSGDIFDGDILLVDTSVEHIAADAAYIIQFDGHLVVKVS